MNNNNNLEKEKKEYYVKRKDLEKYDVNPWAHELVHTMRKGIKVTGFSSTRHSLINNETGEVNGDIPAIVGTRKIVDKEEFVKFFGAGLVETFELSKGARDVFLTILNAYLNTNTINSAADQIYINHKSAKADLDYKRSASVFISGINELCLKGFLAPVENKEHFYWLNPNLFYKGDRMRIVKEYVVKDSKAHREIKNEEEQLKLI